jgi:hypothetical protein
MAKKATKNENTNTASDATTSPVIDNTTEAVDIANANIQSSKNEEVVEVDWESIQPVFEFRQKLQNLETYFSSMCLQFEKNKANLMNQIVYGQSDLFTMAQDLQKSLNVSENLTYELKLPTSPGEKGYFLRKDD